MSVLKACVDHIALPLTNLFDERKYAFVTPLFKGKGSTKLCDNNRGISLLSPLAKVIERVIESQVIRYFYSCKLFSANQHSLKSGHSCKTALYSILDNWKELISDRKIVMALFIDFKKAIDLINPRLLFRKLFHYGFSNSALNFFVDYFSNRQQSTKVGPQISDKQELSIGVPQGSVLNPEELR